MTSPSGDSDADAPRDGGGASSDGTASLRDGASITDDFELAGDPDAFGRLWTPHRMAYIRGEGPPREPGCPFCNAPKRDDAASLIVHRGPTCFVILNLFPYNPGHLLVCPYRHVAGLDELTDEELFELTTTTRDAIDVVRAVANPSAFNVGLNLGKVAGGSLSDHLHQHIVPRWAGDGNFMPIIAQTKAITQTLDEQWRLLSEAWDDVVGGRAETKTANDAGTQATPSRADGVGHQ